MNKLVLFPIVMAVLFVGAPSSASAADEGRRPHAQGQYDPAAAVYVVAPGDDLQDIAGRFGVTVADLREWNDLASDKIHVGEKLEVAAGPQGGAAALQPQTEPKHRGTTAKVPDTATAGGAEARSAAPASRPTGQASLADNPRALMIISIGLILFCIVVIVLFIIFVHTMPGKIARKRGNPQSEAIEILSLLGLLIFPLWMAALVWAYMRPFTVPVRVLQPEGAVAPGAEPVPERDPASAQLEPAAEPASEA